MRPPLAAVALAAALLLPAAASGQDAPRTPPTAEEARELFAWFDGRGFPELRGKPWVRLSYTHVIPNWKGGPREWEASGFLLEDGEESVRVLTPCAWELECPKASSESGEPGDARFVREDLLPVVKRLVLALEGQPPPGVRKGPPELSKLFGGGCTTYRVGLFVLARAVHAAGEEEWGRRLLACYDRERWVGEKDDPPTLRGLIEEDLGDGILRTEVQEFGVAVLFQPTDRALRPLVPRTRLLATCLRVADRFPGSAAAPKARAMAPLLKRMLAEDEAHRVPEGFPDACPVEERVREWIFRLRDQGGDGSCMHGPPSIFGSCDDTPARRLLDLGLDAVPQLLTTTSSDGLTRAVNSEGCLFGSKLLSVGDAALQVLEEFAGRDFVDAADATDWWKAVRAVGFEKVLVDGILRGGFQASRQAEVLVLRFPEKALAHLLEAIRRCTDRDARAGLVEAIAEIPGDGPVPFLREEAEEGPDPECRRMAGVALRDRGLERLPPK